MADTAPDETIVDNDTGATTDGATGTGATAGVQSLKDNVIKFANDAGDKAKAAAEDGKTRATGALDDSRRCSGMPAARSMRRSATNMGNMPVPRRRRWRISRNRSNPSKSTS